MNRNNNTNRISGLYLGGNVIKRTRRHVPKDNPTTEIVTYTLRNNNDRKFYVNDYAPESYYDIGDQIYLSVYVKSYQKHNKELAYTLCTRKRLSPRGEDF